MKGVIYKYTSPSGKVYIGQTCREHGRRNDFQEKGSYGGYRIDHARAKYGASSFTYEVLFSIEDDDIEKIRQMLNEKESFFIKQYQSNDDRYGYNMNEGGAGNVAMELSEETRTKISISTRRWLSEKGHPLKGKKHSKESIEKMRRNTKKKYGMDNPNYGWEPSEVLKKRLRQMSKERTGDKNGFFGRHHTEETKIFLRNKFGRHVLQIDKDNHKTIAEFKSAGEAAISLGYGRSVAADICKVCNKYVKRDGAKLLTAKGYIWRWADDEDTTFIERRVPKPPSFKGCHVSDENKAIISKRNSKKVKQINAFTDEVIAVHDSATKAAESLGHPKSNSDIGKFCNGKIQRETVLGYKWEWCSQ